MVLTDSVLVSNKLAVDGIIKVNVPNYIASHIQQHNSVFCLAYYTSYLVQSKWTNILDQRLELMTVLIVIQDMKQ